MIIEQKPEDIKENRRITGKALKIMRFSRGNGWRKTHIGMDL